MNYVIHYIFTAIFIILKNLYVISSLNIYLYMYIYMFCYILSMPIYEGSLLQLLYVCFCVSSYFVYRITSSILKSSKDGLDGSVYIFHCSDEHRVLFGDYRPGSRPAFRGRPPLPRCDPRRQHAVLHGYISGKRELICQNSNIS